MLENVFLGIYFILGWMGLQVIVFHIFKVKNKFPIITLLYMLSFLGYIFFLPKKNIADINSIGLYLILFPTYLAFFYYVDRPVSLRILIEFLRAQGRPLVIEDIEHHYSLDAMVERRIKLMQKDRLIFEQNGRFFIDKKGEKLGWIVSRGRKFICSSFLTK